MGKKPIKSIQIDCKECGGSFAFVAGEGDLGENLKAAQFINCSICKAVVISSEDALALANAISAHNKACQDIDLTLENLSCRVWID